MPASYSDSFDERTRVALLHVARDAIARRLGRKMDFPPPPPDLPGAARNAAVFVTLKLGDPERLRGCIGTLEPSLPLREAVAHYAERAAFDDPRFPPLEADELDRVSIHVSVLAPPRPVRDPSEIRIGRDGVVLELGSARGVFLPGVAVEQGWDTSRLLEQLSRKAGLGPDGWRNARLYAFEAQELDERAGG